MSPTQLSDVFFQHEEDLFRFLVRRIKCAFTARDLTQELFLKISSQEDTSHIQNQKAYVFRMAANLATDYLRVQENRAEILEEAIGIMSGGMDYRDAERVMIAKQELARLAEALAELPLISRKVFLLTRFGRKTQQQIATDLGISTSSLEAHIRKVLDHLSAVRDI
ncbi:putative RNA polymerase sigma factor FecI [Nitrospira sp. KM1]|uniref:RNA polymerase sigma factor n=1 Tax=Nitrospira sp. KM1 TaxID=1936990 RepID=UPI0013A72D13|nr:sigma-70 family RNA polymerase sigma factor [Nitrospira sp. KM1]BCA57174.1 putative RNA polymerase sigma factor FecI [Nitrospira sp. KM1]